MPRYFFRPRGIDGREAQDYEGTELADERAALREARFAARELAGHAVTRGEPIGSRAIVVADESGRTIATVAYQDVIDFSVKREGDGIWRPGH